MALEDQRLKIFEAVARERSFTVAARKLGMSQSAVSQCVAELEKKTGRELPVLLEHLNDMDKFKASMNYLQEAAGDLIGKE